mmetsp:Transcript_56187/g.133405  ORF Transcript_56187/g.133405 Transcript_56187/m.133405 type:complete len:289 (-) Transcript_56187:462-1328(-)
MIHYLPTHLDPKRFREQFPLPPRRLEDILHELRPVGRGAGHDLACKSLLADGGVVGSGASDRALEGRPCAEDHLYHLLRRRDQVSCVVDHEGKRGGCRPHARHQVAHVAEEDVDPRRRHKLVLEGVSAERPVEVDGRNRADHLARPGWVHVGLRPQRLPKGVLQWQSRLHEDVVTSVVLTPDEVSKGVAGPDLVEPGIVAPHLPTRPDPARHVEAVRVVTHLAVQDPREEGGRGGEPREVRVDAAVPREHSVPAIHRLVPVPELVGATGVAVVEASPGGCAAQFCPVR